jgi:hypothetical protein
MMTLVRWIVIEYMIACSQRIRDETETANEDILTAATATTAVATTTTLGISIPRQLK